MTPKRDALWLLAALLFGLLVLPFLVYATGVTVLGTYAHGGPLAFLADYLADLARFRWFSWALAIGPLVIAVIWRTASRFR